eukprot:m.30323 g.30323  ORF g.30323 m.30323 type:complete len:137 (+) comp8193_c0_seq1:58-468(+)
MSTYLDKLEKQSERHKEERDWKKRVIDSPVVKKWDQQAESPSRNYISLIITQLGVVFRVWHVNARVVKSVESAKNAASETVCSLVDFVEGESESLSGDIRRYLGQQIYDDAVTAAKEIIDAPTWEKVQFPMQITNN